MGQALNFYKHHLGDYDAATTHLSWDEDQAYTRLLRVYYRTEKPLPKDPGAVYRLVRAITRSQKAAVTAVLHEFFQELQDGWHNKRADEEIAAYRAQASTNKRIARARYAHDPQVDSQTKRARTVQRTVDDSTQDRAPNQIPEPQAKNRDGEVVDVDLSQKPLKTIEKSEDQQRDVRSLVSATAAHLTRRKFG